MKKGTLYKYVWATAVLVSSVFSGSCVRENLGDSEPVPVKVTLPTRMVDFGDYEEDDIVSLRMIIFRTGQEKCIMNELIYPSGDFNLDTTTPHDGSSDTGVFGEKELRLPQGIYDFFLMANETKEYTDYGEKLMAVNTRSDLAAIRVSEINVSGAEDVGGYPAGRILLEEDVVPFPRAVYRKKIYIGNNVTNDAAKQVSLDEGQTWQSELPLTLQRVSAKMNIGIRKQTADTQDELGNPLTSVNDVFYITDIRLLHVPSYAYLISRQYDGTFYNSIEWYKWVPNDEKPNRGREDNDYFTENTTTYARSNRKDVVVPEYLLSDPGDEGRAIILEIRGDYYRYKEGETVIGEIDTYESYGDVQWITPMNFGTVTTPDYQTRINNAYDVLVTITQPQNFTFTPHVTILVSGWEQDTEGYYNAGNGDVYLSGNWTAGQPNGSGILYVDMGDYLEYTFTFNRADPDDKSIIRWKAALSNPVDFQLLTTGGAATGGYARAGDQCKVRVSPTALSSRENTTELHIHIDDGTGGVIKLPLNPHAIYSIHQNPR